MFDEIDKQLEAVVSILQSHGGLVGVDPEAPAFVKRAFLNMIMDCPECRELVLRGKPLTH